MSTSPYDDLLREFESRHLVARPPNEAERELLRRSAIPLVFDEALVDAALRVELPKGEPVPFEKLVASNAIQRVPQSLGLFRMRDGERASNLESYGMTPEQPGGTPEFRRISRRIEAELQKRGEDWRLERLRHTLVVEPERGYVEIEKLWRSAEDRFELTELQDLLDLVRERLALGDPRLKTLELRFAARLRARGMWVDEWYRTSRMFEREKLTVATKQLLTSGSDAFVLQIYARGGIGKTMFIRWLLARYCAAKGIPSAKLDFDDEDAAKVTSTTWRIVLRLAEQLNPQLPGDALERVLSLGGELAGQRERVDAATSAELDGQLAQAFVFSLNEARRSEPVLIVLDTMEEAFRGGNEVANLVQTMVALHNGQFGPPCPALRVVFAGRFDLRDKVPGFDALVGAAAARHLELAAFDEVETDAFLRKDRGLPIDSGLAKKIGANLGNVPWKLALAADLVEMGALPADKLGSTSDLDVLWLTERVLLRIRKDDPERRPIADAEVRWLLRYGCVPRRLTRDVVSAVIMRYLPEAVAGTSAYDDANDDLPDEIEHEDLFPHVRSREPGDDLDAGDLWSRLSSYAGTYATAWVWFVGDDRNTLVFQKDVSRPMRRLLAKHPVHQMLHQDLVTYFQERAENDPERWSQWMREAVYHRFQLDGEDAGAYFFAQLGKAALYGDTARFELIDELTGDATCDDYVDEDGQPRTLPEAAAPTSPGKRLIASDTLARAWLERAAREITQTPDWNRISSSLATAGRFRAASGAGDEDYKARHAYVLAALYMSGGNAGGAIDSLEPAASKLQGPERQRALQLLGASYVTAYRYEDAIVAYRTLLTEREAAGEPLISVLEARELLALAYYHGDRTEDAIGECLSVVEHGENPEAVAFVTRLARLLSECLVRLGQPGLVAHVLEQVPRIRLVRGRDHLDDLWVERELAVAGQGDLVQAANNLADIEVSQSESPPNPWLHEAKGMVRGLLMDFATATAALERAQELWAVTSRERAATCLVNAIELQLWAIGSLKHVKKLLDDASRLSLDEQSRRRFDFALLRLALLARLPDPPDFASELAKLAKLEPTLPPRALVRLAVAELCYAKAGHRAWARFADALDRVQGGLGRLAVLLVLERFPTPPPPPADIAQRIQAMVIDPPIPKLLERARTLAPHAIDSAILELRQAEVLRFLGDRANAAERLGRAEHHILADRNTYLYRRLLLARDRLGWGENPSPSDVDMAILSAEERVGPDFVRAAVIEQAERMLQIDETDLARSMILELKRLRRPTLSQWDAREAAILARVGNDLAATQGIQLAIQHYMQLEDAVRARVVEERYGEAARAPRSVQSKTSEASTAEGPRTTNEAPVCRLVIALAGDEFRRTLWFSDEHHEELEPFNGVLLPATSPSLSSAEKYVRVPDNLEDVARHAQSVIDSALELHPSIPAVCLEIAEKWLHAVPWELARSGAALYRLHARDRQSYKSVRWIQTALNRLLGAQLVVDGIFGPQTQAALFKLPPGEAPGDRLLAALQRVPPGLRPRALMVLPSRSFIERGLIRHSPTKDVERRLQNVCAEVSLVGLDELERMVATGSALARDPPSLVFVRGRMRESRRLGGLSLNLFTDESMMADSEQSQALLTVPALDRLLEFLSAGQAAPTVILEAAPSGSQREDLVQLVLRNVFAAELFSLGSASAVLAGGFYDPYGEWRMLAAFEESLGLGLSVGVTMKKLRDEAAKIAGPARMPLHALALFAYDPNLPTALPSERAS